MDLIKHYSSVKLSTPAWEDVRAIYKKLSEEFYVLTDSFNLKFDPETLNYLDHLIVAIDEVDHFIDELPDKESRDAITSSFVDFLSDDKTVFRHKLASKSLAKKMEILKHIVHVKSIHESFTKASKAIFYNTEVKRHTKDEDELLNYIKQEGIATALLPLSILKISAEEKFGEFFTRFCKIMGIADLIFDAKEDYKNGLISVKPSWSLYLKLIKILIPEGIKLLFSFPKKIRFLRYCLKFIGALMKE